MRAGAPRDDHFHFAFFNACETVAGTMVSRWPRAITQTLYQNTRSVAISQIYIKISLERSHGETNLKGERESSRNFLAKGCSSHFGHDYYGRYERFNSAAWRRTRSLCPSRETQYFRQQLFLFIMRLMNDSTSNRARYSPNNCKGIVHVIIATHVGRM